MLIIGSIYQQRFSSRTAGDNLSSINTSRHVWILFLPKLMTCPRNCLVRSLRPVALLRRPSSTVSVGILRLLLQHLASSNKLRCRHSSDTPVHPPPLLRSRTEVKSLFPPTPPPARLRCSPPPMIDCNN
jgi:hypothetical protein